VEDILMKERKNTIRIKYFSSPKTQPSLFNYIKEKDNTSAFQDLDLSFLRHPFRSFKEAWKTPRTKPSLFHYIEEEPKIPFSGKRFFRELFTGIRGPAFIPSVFFDPEGLAQDNAVARTRRMESWILSLACHLGLVAMVWLIVYHPQSDGAEEENIVYIGNPMVSPYEGDGRDGGGGGGGGKNEPAPPATGRMPETTRVQMIPPDPSNPQPLMPAEDLLAQVASVQMPIDIPQNQDLPIGDIFAPPNGSMSSGPGSGGGIGTGSGTGVGSGTGAGVGPGSGGGMGGGSGGGMGSGIGTGLGFGGKYPESLVKTRPLYTEEARKAKVQGTVVLSVVVLKNGTLDNFKVVRGLGYGLDESAITEISTKWRFKPGTKNGSPVDVRINIEVVFNLY
jgi:TonB family protein